MATVKKNSFITIIQPRTNLISSFNLKELWHYKDLIILFVRRDFVVQYKQSILGPLWFFIQPLLTTIIFTVVFGQIAKISTDGTPPMLFYLAGTLMWNYFSLGVTKTSDTFIANSGIFGKVYFPRLVVPISIVISNIFTFLIQFLLFLAFLLYFYFHGSLINPSFVIIILPFLIIQMAILGMGIGIWVSSLTTKYRDLRFLLTFGIQLWMYATPVVYPLSIIPDKWKWIMALNPMSSIIEIFRYSFLGVGNTNLYNLLVSIIVSFLIFVTGIIVFNKIEKDFMDVI